MSAQAPHYAAVVTGSGFGGCMAALPLARNFCDRQGRRNVGRLPGARHTLNKQLMGAMYGTPEHPEPVFHHKELQLEPLSEVEVIVTRPQGSYRGTLAGGQEGHVPEPTSEARQQRPEGELHCA